MREDRNEVHGYGAGERIGYPTGVVPALERRVQHAPKVESKSSNPKDAIGSSKAPLDMVPSSLVYYAAMSFGEGATKYGAYNWRFAGVRASIYRAALERHLTKWWNGQDVDPTTGVPELASVIACAAIILDAELVGKLEDDRPPRANIAKLQQQTEELFAKLRELHKNMHPTHYTQKLLNEATNNGNPNVR